MKYRNHKIRLLGLNIKEDCNPKLIKTLATGYYPFYTAELSDAFFLRNVSVSAIVGMNGAGKSSLLELIFRMINNFSACLVGNTIKRNGADEIYFIPGVKASLDYEIRGTKGTLYCDDGIVALAYGDKKYFLSDPDLTMTDDYRDFEVCHKPNAAKRSEIASYFFYTIVMNYALQAYNSLDYQDEKAEHYQTDKVIGTSSNGNWMNSMFHKNDGYASPIVLNPYRNQGVIDMKTETALTKDRLAGILVEAKRKNREFIDGYQLLRIVYAFNPYRVIEKLPKKYRTMHVTEVENEFRRLYGVENSFVRLVLDAYGYSFANSNSMSAYGCIYLIYKTLTIPSKYPSYAEYASVVDIGKIDGSLDDEAKQRKLIDLIQEIKKDKSHITTKIRQTIHFLDAFDQDIWIENEFTYGDYESWLRMDKKNTSLEATMELMPPPIFSSEIILKKDKDDAEVPFYKMSSGERQFLFLMSSIIYHVMNIKSVPTSRMAYRYINVVLDEVELCFHPEYQRTFIYKLLRSIERLHLNTYCGFNVIITTHSPFLLSDIPQGNVLYLEDGHVKNKEYMQNPFAANVNDILQQSFFLKNGFMGEFAKQKILKVIDGYTKKNPDANDANDAKEAVELLAIIGEPLLKNKLSTFIEDKDNEKNTDR